MDDNLPPLQIDITNNRFDCRKKYFLAIFVANNKDIIRTSLENLCDFAQHFPVLAADTQSEQLPVVVFPLLQRFNLTRFQPDLPITPLLSRISIITTLS